MISKISWDQRILKMGIYANYDFIKAARPPYNTLSWLVGQ